MPNGIIIIDKPQDWTSMDVCHPSKCAAFAGAPCFDFTCAAEMNSALRRGFSCAETLVRRTRAVLGA